MKYILILLSPLLFLNIASAQVLSGGNMESWHTISVGFPATQVDAPDHWFGADSLIFTVAPFIGVTSGLQEQMSKSSDAHSGSFAAEVTTKNQGSTLGTIPGIMANARPGVDILNFDPNDPMSSITYTGGTSISSRIGYVSAWLKYSPQNADKAQMVVLAVLAGQGAGGADSIVGNADTVISGQVSSYTKFEVTLNYIDPNVVPDKLLILFLSSTNANANVPAPNSTLLVDDVEAGIHPNGIKVSLLDNEIVRVYPNPSKGEVNINTSIKGDLSWDLYTASGQLVSHNDFKGQTTINVQEIPAGIYFYTINGNKGNLVRKGKLLIQ